MIISDVSLASSLQSCMLNRRPSSSFTSESVCPPRKVSRNYRDLLSRQVEIVAFFSFLSSPLAGVLHHQQQDIPVPRHVYRFVQQTGKNPVFVSIRIFGLFNANDWSLG